MSEKHLTFIENPGGCIVSNNLISGKGALRWAFRETPVNPQDNG